MMRKDSFTSVVVSRLVVRRDGAESWRWERGQTLVLAALFMVVLVGALALAVDVGNTYAQRRRAQNAADAGALAGVRVLALGRTVSEIDAAVHEYAVQRNLGQSYAMTVMTPTRSVVVTVTKTFPTYFATVVGAPTMTVVATAEGVYTFTVAMTGLAPLAVHKDAFDANDKETGIQIWDTGKYPSAPGIIAGGERGWLDFSNANCGASDIAMWIINGYGGEVYTAQACEDMGSTDPNCAWILGVPGTKNVGDEPLRSTYAPYDLTKRMLLVPLFDEVRPTELVDNPELDKLDYHIVGFAAFKVDKVIKDKVSDDDPTQIRKIFGRFSHYVPAWKPGGKYDTGVRVIGLQR